MGTGSSKTAQSQTHKTKDRMVTSSSCSMGTADETTLSFSLIDWLFMVLLRLLYWDALLLINRQVASRNINAK
jgi:hypothetical protein